MVCWTSLRCEVDETGRMERRPSGFRRNRRHDGRQASIQRANHHHWPAARGFPLFCTGIPPTFVSATATSLARSLICLDLSIQHANTAPARAIRLNTILRYVQPQSSRPLHPVAERANTCLGRWLAPKSVQWQSGRAHRMFDWPASLEIMAGNRDTGTGRAIAPSAACLHPPSRSSCDQNT